MEKANNIDSYNTNANKVEPLQGSLNIIFE